jgi:hypothetical protein
MDNMMQASVLVILFEGDGTLEVYPSEVDARRGLLQFVDERWSDYFGHLLPPSDEDIRINIFFKTGGAYLVAKVDLSEIIGTTIKP